MSIRELYWSSLCETDLEAYKVFTGRVFDHATAVAGSTTFSSVEGSQVSGVSSECAGGLARVVDSSGAFRNDDLVNAGLRDSTLGGAVVAGVVRGVERTGDLAAAEVASDVGGADRCDGGGRSVWVNSKLRGDVNTVGVGSSRQLVGPNGGVSIGRGRNYERNQLRRARAKSGFKSFFSGCSGEVQQSLADSRAAFYIQQNKANEAKAASELKCVQAREKSRIFEMELEDKRLKVEAARAARIKKTLDELPEGYVETIVSSGCESPVPSLESGSVSPNSSISCAEADRLVGTIKRLQELNLGLVSQVADIRKEVSKEKKRNSDLLFRRGKYADDFSVVANGEDDFPLKPKAGFFVEDPFPPTVEEGVKRMKNNGLSDWYVPGALY